jgi:hypothetical protein
MGPKGERIFLEGFHNRCRAVIEQRPTAEDFDFDQVWVRAPLGSAMREPKPQAFLKAASCCVQATAGGRGTGRHAG